MARTKAGKTVDRRIARTRAALREALVRSILDHGWDRTSVQTVCDRANIGRSTFYAHFARCACRPRRETGAGFHMRVRSGPGENRKSWQESGAAR